MGALVSCGTDQGREAKASQDKGDLTMTNFFTSAKTCEELKRLYKQLAMVHHPDRGGDLETMKAINAEYELMFAMLKDIHATKDGKTYTSDEPTSEIPRRYMDIIDKLIRCDKTTIEICGSFIWVSGDTKPYKDLLKEMGFKWSQNKKSWYLPPTGYKRKSHRKYEMDEIRELYGSQEVETDPYKKLATV